MLNASNGVTEKCPVLLQTGFRIFFLGAAFYSVLSIAFWMFFYTFGWNIFIAMPVNVWHGHEMIYGYTMAVVAGFLLTAVMNWTGLQTLNGTPLLILFLLWMTARILSFMPSQVPREIMAVCDIAFLAFLAVAVVRPVIQVKQWRQFAVLSKVILLIPCSIFIYWSLFTEFLTGAHKGLLFALYMILSLIFTISRRVIPFFIEKGVGYPVTLRNWKVLDIASLLLLLLFSVLDVFWPQVKIIPVLAGLLAVVHTIRLMGWYTPGIWKKPLLWILFAGYSFLIIGFVLKALSYLSAISSESVLHAFTYGGIGLFTLGMMARVSLGHTGRNIHEGPPSLFMMFMTLILGAFVRVFLPIFDDVHYPVWITVSQILWMVTFILFIFEYFPILTSKRIDGKFG